MKRTRGFAPILILVLIIVLGAIGYLGYKNYWPKISSLISPQNYEECLKSPGSLLQESFPAVCVTRSGARFTQPLTPDQQQNLVPPTDTSNWKTYTNTKFGFSVQYPSTWKVDNNPETTRVGEQAVALISSSELGPGLGNGAENQFPSHYLGITVIPSKQTIQEYISSEANGNAQTLKDMDQRSLKIGISQAISFIEPGAGGRGRMVIISNGENIFLFAFPFNYNTSSDPIPNQILSTFKFTEASPSSSPKY